MNTDKFLNQIIEASIISNEENKQKKIKSIFEELKVFIYLNTLNEISRTKLKIKKEQAKMIQQNSSLNIIDFKKKIF